jgi:hypothetical protein
MAATEEKPCINHSERESMTRCDVCLKPLCEECVVAHEQRPYCSEECLKNQLGFNSKLGETLQDDRKKTMIKNIRNTLLLVIILILVYHVYQYMQEKKKNPPVDSPSSSLIIDQRSLYHL